MSSLITPVVRKIIIISVCYNFQRGTCTRGDKCKYAHITDESKKEKKLKIRPRSGKSQHNNPPNSSHAGPITFNHRQHYLDKIGPGKSPITASNPRGLSITQNKIYKFIYENFEPGENNDIDYGRH